jgi:hypothetical protein
MYVNDTISVQKVGEKRYEVEIPGSSLTEWGSKKLALKHARLTAIRHFGKNHDGLVMTVDGIPGENGAFFLKGGKFIDLKHYIDPAQRKPKK